MGFKYNWGLQYWPVWGNSTGDCNTEEMSVGLNKKNKLEEKLDNDHSKETQRSEEQVHFKNEFSLGYTEGQNTDSSWHS